MRALAVLGAGTVVAGFVVLFERGLAGFFDFSYAFVTLVGALAVLQGLRYALGRRKAEMESVDLGEPERRYAVDVPGDGLDERIRRSSGRTRGANRARERIRTRLRDVATAELVAKGDYTPAEADEAVRTGTWTDDAAAAAFLSETVPMPLREVLRARLSGQSSFRFGLSRTLAELEEGNP
ncbi:MAG: hypothetical protein ABEH81_15545 [Halopenitus sp.]